MEDVKPDSVGPVSTCMREHHANSKTCALPYSLGILSPMLLGQCNTLADLCKNSLACNNMHLALKCIIALMLLGQWALHN